jgi:hypothetical protein
MLGVPLQYATLCCSIMHGWAQVGYALCILDSDAVMMGQVSRCQAVWSILVFESVWQHVARHAPRRYRTGSAGCSDRHYGERLGSCHADSGVGGHTLRRHVMVDWASESDVQLVLCLDLLAVGLLLVEWRLLSRTRGVRSPCPALL